MTVDDVKRGLDSVRKEKYAHGAHVAQDELYESLLRAIADGTCEDPAGCAAEALKVLDIPFSRYYS